MSTIHPTAIIDPQAQIGKDVSIGAYTIVEGNTVIGEGTQIGPQVRIATGTRIGPGCRIFTGAVLGTIPQDLKFQGEETLLEIGEHTTVREFATLNRGTRATGVTRIGSHCLLMAYVHVAHDCVIEDHVILANAVNLAGHVKIEEWANVGGMTPVHQFVRIGCHAFVGGGFRAPKDIPPYVLASGIPLRYTGLNTVGLKRRNFSSETLLTLKRVYRLIFRSGKNVSQALAIIEKEFTPTPEVQHVIQFIRSSERGIIR
ncbi:MAG: acyl-ACP--UDP-N-acetylglucosamine O-acyltransferase [Calditrichaeota bacterium]|nr:MAG: acyl-ACP--UDP-N-acetylglucosamine O-acyltransferase [Calditrichota bacterium]